MTARRVFTAICLLAIVWSAGWTGYWMGEEDARLYDHRIDQAWALGIEVGERCNDAVRPANVTWSDCSAIVTGANVVMANEDGERP